MASASTPSTDGTEWAIDLDGEKAESLSTGGADDPSNDGEALDYTYIRIEGITAEELSDEHKAIAEKRVVDFLLRKGYPISAVNVLPTDTTIIEYDE